MGSILGMAVVALIFSFVSEQTIDVEAIDTAVSQCSKNGGLKSLHAADVFGRKTFSVTCTDGATFSSRRN